VDRIFTTFEGQVATICGKTNRFGLTPYTFERKERKKNDRGDWEWQDITYTVFYNNEGRACQPPVADFDSRSFRRKQDVEREALATRRHKDNWI
jgi:hypothetical protein